MSIICHECHSSIVSEICKEYHPLYSISILKRSKNELLISNQHQLVYFREYRGIVDGIKTLDEIEKYEEDTKTTHPTLFVVSDETKKVLEEKGIFVSLVAPDVSRLVATNNGGNNFEKYILPEYGFISYELAKRALPNCFKDLTSRLDDMEWLEFEGIKTT